MKGLCHAGAHLALEQLDVKPTIVVGTSAGSLIGSMVAAGMKHVDILQVINDTNFKAELLDPASTWDHWKAHRNLSAIKANITGLVIVLAATIISLVAAGSVASPVIWFKVVLIGLAFSWVVIAYRIWRLSQLCKTSALKPLYKGEKMTEWLNSTLAEYLIKQGGPTAQDLLANNMRVKFKHLPITFAVVGTDLTRTKTRVFSSFLDPEFSVAQAVLASSSVPLFFPGIQDSGSHILDGGFMSRLPIGVALDAGASQVIAFDLGSPSQFDLSGWGGFIGAVYEAASDAQISAYAKNPNVTVIDIDSASISPWQFDATGETKIKAVLDGHTKSFPRLQNLRLSGKI